MRFCPVLIPLEVGAFQMGCWETVAESSFRKTQLLLPLLPFGGWWCGRLVVVVVAALPFAPASKDRRQRRDGRGRLGGNSSKPTCRHRMCTANYLRPLDEIICLSKRQINTKPNYPAKGSALFASCARPVRLFRRIKFGITLSFLFLFFFSFSFVVCLVCFFLFILSSRAAILLCFGGIFIRT